MYEIGLIRAQFPLATMALACVAFLGCEVGVEVDSITSAARDDLAGVDVQGALSSGMLVAEGHLGWTGVAQGVGDNGQSFMTVPIVVPPGRAGVQPTLSLSYSSGGGDGPMGVGWQLSGLGQIARCRQDVGRDGERNDRLFDQKEPALCLDGERLVRNTGVDDNDPFTAGDYRLESSGASVIFQEGELDDPGTEFIVRDRDGTIRRYGGVGSAIQGVRMAMPADSDCVREECYESSNHDRPDPASCMDEAGECAAQVIMDGGSPVTYTYSWLLRQVEDVSGNTVDIEYTTRQEDNAVEVLPSVVHYTGHVNEGKGERRVEFSYDERPDAHVSFTSGFGMGAFRRLRRVETFAPGTSGAVRSYDLRYSESEDTARFLLDELTECSFGGACREPVTFEYGSRDGFSLAHEEIPDATGPWMVLDSDGNGQHELMISNMLYRWINPGWLGFPSDVVGLGPFDHDFNGVDEVISGGEVMELNLVPGGGGLHYEGTDVGDFGEHSCRLGDEGPAGVYTGNFEADTPGLQTLVACARRSGEDFLVSDFDGDGVH